MNKKILYLLLSLTIFSFTGCANTSTTPTNSIKSNKTLNSSAQATPVESTNNDANTLTLNDNSSFFCPFVFNGNNLIFPNPDENNRISIIPDPLPENILESKAVKDFAEYSTDNLTLIDDIVYFSDSVNNNALSSLKLNDKTYSKLTTHSINNLISVNTDLFYINKDDNNKIYKFDTLTSNSIIVCPDNVGSFIVNGDFIIYQNLSDNSKLYSIKTDGTNKQKLTDYTASSFVPYEGQLLFFNSSDNNNLYSIDPSTLTSKRIYIMNGFKLKIINKSLYFINGDDSNNLYSLSVDLKNLTATYKIEIAQGVNDYYLTTKGIFYNPSINVNNIYYKKISA